MLKLTLRSGTLLRPTKLLESALLCTGLSTTTTGRRYISRVWHHLPTTDVRLFSPQIYHKLHGGHSTVDGDNVCMRLHGRCPSITIPIACGGSNFPCVQNSFVGEKVKQDYASKMQSALKASRLFTALDFFGEMPFTMPA